ncbi:calcium/calmodulin-dependent protein kinase type II delta chain-like [Dendronephthya gigantea]|uniref:calcium/calmodulin-dependent protein kinase type II delta chain-like n=1 Tax=Dendronephthya gigantea TaxID=151771 RepID=UPI00106C9556|nr:calcium/calmodulin-dependent protein kinase type II delta chain-like [Dendronephthya gigantea]
MLTTKSSTNSPFKPKELKIHNDFESKYTYVNYVNAGTFGKVYKCCKKGEERAEYAVKIQEVSFQDNFEDSSYIRALTEAKVWNGLEHLNIAKLFECFLQNDRFFFVMELVPGNNLFDEILKKSTYTETNACLYIKQILSALAYLHVNKIIHRDVKPDNIMLYQKEMSSVVKLVDFGLARRLENGKNRMECAPSGAPLYLAPETIMEVALGYPVDVWSCGVIMYILLYGSPPFWSEDTNKLFLAIIGSEVDFLGTDEKEPVSFLANDLIQEMLVKNQNDRITASDALDHPWITQSRGLKLSREHRRSTLERLSNFRRSTSVIELQQRFNGMKVEGNLSGEKTRKGQFLDFPGYS